MGAPADSPRPLVVVGEIMGTIGNTGDLRVKVHNPESDLLLTAETLVLVQGETRRDMRVLDCRVHGKGLRMCTDAAGDREQGRALYGAQLCVPRDALPDLADDEFYVVDLVGARAYLADGTEVGTVTSYLPYPAADVLAIETPAGKLELPMMEPYLQDVDVGAGRITVAHLEDLRQDPPQ